MVFSNNLLLGAAGQGGGYEIDQSILFNDNDAAYMSRTSVTPTSTTIFTISLWFKRSLLSSGYPTLINEYSGNSDAAYLNMRLYPDDTINVSGYATNWRTTTRRFRDPSAWYHFVLAVDTNQGTAANRIKLYINGVEETSFTANSNPGIGTTLGFNTGGTQNIARINPAIGGTNYFDGYMSEFNFIDGQALAPTDFGEYNDDGVWVPKAYAGTYGTNGFYLTGEDSADLGKDYSGNGNDFTSSGLTADDQVVDTPTDNYATFSPINVDAVTLSNGNLFCASAGYWSGGAATMSLPTTGKWYIETLVGNRFGSYMAQGFVPNDGSLITSAAQAIYYGSQDSTTTPNYGLGMSRGDKFGFYAATGTTTASVTEPDGSTLYSTNEIYICHALDLDNQRYWVGTAFVGDSSVTWFGPSGSGADPETPSTGLDISAYLATYGDYGLTFFHAPNTTSGNPYATVDFGQSGYTFTKPTGFSALSTANLPGPAIADGSAYFQATTYTGAGYPTEVNQSGNSTFQPDFVWVKRRNAATTHDLFDAVRGVSSQLYSNLTNAEGTVSNAISFDADGFTAAADPLTGDTGSSGNTFVGWQWLAANGTASNTDGDFTSTVSANQTAGFSVLTWTGDGTSTVVNSIGHGLGKVPSLIIMRRRSPADDWFVYAKPITESYYLKLNSTAAQTIDTGNNTWGGTAPTSSVFYTEAIGSAAYDYVAYCFAEVEGFSKFGSYKGNGSADGPFVWCGFRPAYILIKNTTSAYNWTCWDTSRSPINPAENELYPSIPNAEVDGNRPEDFVSNGFKIRNNNVTWNGNGTTYIFMAFAEHPFGGDGVAPATAR